MIKKDLRYGGFFYFRGAESLDMRGLLLFLVLFSSAVQAQQVVVMDSISNEPISLVSVYDGKTGVITSSSGAFYWQKPEADSITLSSLGYAQKK